MIYFLDFDFTIADTSITKFCSGDYKEKQKLIPQFKIYNKAVYFLEKHKNNPVYIVSGNVGSTIKKTIKHFKLPISEDNVVGYKQGMPMDNLKRKIAVINDAIKRFKLEDKLNEITYIGDQLDDKTACKIVGIKFLLSDWDNILANN